MKPRKVLFFDLGGVLIRIRSWPEALQHVGLDPQASPLVESLWFAHEAGMGDTQDFLRLAAAHSGLPEAGLAQAMDAILVEPFADAANLTAQLLAAGIELGCLSNTNPYHWAIMNGRRDSARSLATLALLRHPVASFLTGSMKPDAAIYEAAERLSSLNGQDIAFFDDREENIAAAQARGWRAERINPLHPDLLPAAQMQIHLRSWGWLAQA